MLDQRQRTIETFDVKDIHQTFLPKNLRVGTMRWVVPGQIARTGYFAGRKAYRKAERLADRMDVPESLPELPTSAELMAYFQQHQPPNLTLEEAELWQAYFILGWFSRVLLIDY